MRASGGAAFPRSPLTRRPPLRQFRQAISPAAPLAVAIIFVLTTTITVRLHATASGSLAVSGDGGGGEIMLPFRDHVSKSNGIEMQDVLPIVRLKKQKNTTNDAIANLSHSLSRSPRSRRENKGAGGDDDAGTTATCCAACLLTKDDNHFLVEWIAYHFHVLPLRYLILAIDPTSNTTPRRILNRWDKRMKFEVWDDESKYVPRSVLNGWGEGNVTTTSTERHRSRQVHFYQACLKRLKQQDQSWVIVSDTDEFVRVNVRHSSWNRTRNTATIDGPASVLSFLERIQAERGGRRMPPCLYGPRYQYGAIDGDGDNDGNQRKKGAPRLSMPSGFIWNSTDFLTMRWHYRAKSPMANGKNVINVASVDWDDFPIEVPWSVHRVLPQLCPDPKLMRRPKRIEQNQDIVLSFNHYTGSEEQRLFRNDPRTTGKLAPANRFREALHAATLRDHPSETLGGWLNEFVQNVGEAEANRLLEGVGSTRVK